MSGLLKPNSRKSHEFLRSRFAASLRRDDRCARVDAMILHLLKRREWDAAVQRGAYAPSTLSNEGFIHCSTIAQAAETALRDLVPKE